MPKRKANEIENPLATPQAKYPCFKVRQCASYEEHRVLDMVTTPPPENSDARESGLVLDEEDALVARLVASQTALMKHLDQKYRRFQAIAPQKAFAMNPTLATLSEAMKTLNQEIDALRSQTAQFDHVLQASTGTTSCCPWNPTYFAPHQYVPVPQS